MPRAQAGVAAAIASTSRQVGRPSASRSSARSSPPAAAPRYAAAFTEASRTAWWIIAGCGLAVLVLGALTTGRWARETARRTAERLEAMPQGRRAGTAHPDQQSARP